MKKTLLTFALMLVAVFAHGAKAYPIPITITQPDGKELTVKTFGDENFHWCTTADGVLLAHVGKYYYIASVDSDGNITPTDQLAHNTKDRNEHELKLIARQDKKAFYNENSAPRRAAILKSKINENASPKYVPHKGSPKIVVLLVEFQDLKFSVNNPVEAFDEYFNKEKSVTFTDFGNKNDMNYGSVKQYFDDMSNGQFTPQFDIYGPVTVSQDMKYYGGTSSNGNDEKCDELTKEAVELSKDLLDYTQYDYDNDDTVDLVYIIYAGYMQNFGGPNESIWAKAHYITGTEVDGIKCGRYCMSSELYPKDGETRIASIGVTCHEFSHCLGLPDLYPTTATAQQNYTPGMEYWSLMDGGEYTQNGYYPTAYTAWEREALDWMRIETLTDKEFVILKNIDEDGKAYRIHKDGETEGNEYIVIQNIRDFGWNKVLGSRFGKGMLVTHVDYNANAFFSNRVNTGVNGDYKHSRMTIIPADNEYISSYAVDNNVYTQDEYMNSLKGDLFSATNGITEISSFSMFSGTMNKPIYDIQEDENGIITFKFLDPTVTGIKDAIVENYNADNSRIYTLDGRYAGTHKDNLRKGIYIINNKKVIIQ